MAQYINKSALVAEIERRLEEIASASSENNRELSAIYGSQMYELINLAQYINTLKVKEVDLEKELDVIIDSLNDDKYEHLSIRQQLSLIAIHFFELGLKAKEE